MTDGRGARGTIFVCDYAAMEGKVHIVGAGWTACSPNRKNIVAVASLELPPPTDDSPEIAVSISAELWDQTDWDASSGKPRSASGVDGTLEIYVERNRPPAMSVLLPIPLEVSLEPDRGYVIALRERTSGEVLGIATFMTFPSDEDDDQNESSSSTD